MTTERGERGVRASTKDVRALSVHTMANPGRACALSLQALEVVEISSPYAKLPYQPRYDTLHTNVVLGFSVTCANMVSHAALQRGVTSSRSYKWTILPQPDSPTSPLLPFSRMRQTTVNLELPLIFLSQREQRRLMMRID